jgi:adenylate cyclase
VNRSAAVLELLPDLRFAAACVDIEMPGMNGWELVERIRAGEAGSAARSMPMVAVTGHSGAEMADRAGAHGFTSVLSKPFTINQIEQTLREALAGAAVDPDADRSNNAPIKRTNERPAGPEPKKPVAETPTGGVSLP